jgi:hypothetical protein
VDSNTGFLDKAVETALLPPVAVSSGLKSGVNEIQQTRFFVMSSEVEAFLTDV